MKIKIPAILAFCFFTLSALAQNSYSIKGSAIDTSSKVKLVNATICVLNAKDSILRKFTYAGENGSFAISGLPAGKFILLMSYKDYADYVEPFTLDATHPTVNFAGIVMRLKSKILQEVMIKGQVTAIKIKGDTTEFNAKAYVIQPNDKVEDLLKQLPGMQVDKDGKITANGQAVNKVLVDGEEFFGDDPTLVTKNIRADMVDKVQLYDKKSDQAAFTGIDDGIKTKTINIKLKEDKKNGTFGKVTGMVGTDGYYDGQGIYNRFKAHEKYSAYVTVANDGKTGLGFGDSNNLGTVGGNVQIGDDGSVSIFITNNDALDSFNGTYDGKGLPLARSGGLHYDGKWNSDNESINTNYKIGSVEVNGTTTTTSQQTLASGAINTNSTQTFDNYAFRQKLDAAYTIKLDTATTLKVSADGTLKNFTVNNDYNSTAENETGGLINQQIRNVKNNGDQQIYDVSALYTKKFKKPRRTFSWNLSEAYNNNETKGYLYSKTDYYNPSGSGVKDSTSVVDQYKTTNTISSVLSSNMTFTEPISKYTSVMFNYGLGININTQDSRSFDQSAPGVYNVLDVAYTNDYKFNQLTNQVGAIINYKRNKLTFNFGTKVADVDFKQVDENTGIVYRRDFINWAPQANFQYRISQQEGISVNYNGNTTQPTISQIQPVRVNTDPQNITIGNAGLKPSFSNNIFFNYNSYKVLTGQNIFIYGSLNFTSDAIVNNTFTDTATAKSTTQYVNLNNKTPYNYNLNASLSREIKPIGITVGLNLGTNGNVSYSYSNGLINMSKANTYSAALQLSKYAAKKYNFSVRGGPQYTLNEFSLQSTGNNNAVGLDINGYASYYLPAKFIISSDIRYNYTAKTQAFDAQYKDIWNATLSKTFLKDDKLRVSFTANDMLDQNTNFSRRITGNTITQSNTNGIKRYFMFSVAWDFTKFGTTTAPAKKLMMMKAIFTTLTCLFITTTALFAQNAHIITSGSIEYEKSVNTFAIIKKAYGANMQGFSQQAFEQYQKTQPQFKVLKSTLTFNNDKTLFTPIIPENTGGNYFGDLPFASQRNTVYTDLSTNTSTSQRGFFEETFLLKDSVRKINWKITDETREVAGYMCRRANAVILDSVYVVAFYTTEIHVSGGPESFTGLPGMILELALPHDNVIWRATKVNDVPIPAAGIMPPKKGKAVTPKQFMETFNSLVKDAGKNKRIDMMKLDYLL